MKPLSLTAGIVSSLVFLFGTWACFGDTGLQNWPIIGDSDAGVSVQEVQLLLRAHGYSISTDGSFGHRTKTALRQFQHAHHLIDTGETNDPTWEALIVPIHQGSTGPAVQAAQIGLREDGYAVVVDGVFGSQMKLAVRKFQWQTGHTIDGIIGRNTWYGLLGADTGGPD